MQVRNVARLVKGDNLAMTITNHLRSQNKPSTTMHDAEGLSPRETIGSPPLIRFTLVGRLRTADSSSSPISVLTRNRLRNGSKMLSTFSIVSSLLENDPPRKRVPDAQPTSESFGEAKLVSPQLLDGALRVVGPARRGTGRQARAPLSGRDRK